MLERKYLLDVLTDAYGSFSANSSKYRQNGDITYRNMGQEQLYVFTIIKEVQY